MEYRSFEQRLLDTIFTTDVPINPATIAFLYKVTTREASDLLQQAAVHGLLNIESDEEGNILYVFPNRQRIGHRDGGKPAGSPGAGAGGGLSTAMVRAVLDGSSQGLASARTPHLSASVAPQHIDMVEAATGLSGGGSAALGSAAPSAVPVVDVHEAARPVEPGNGGGATMRCQFCAEVILAGAKKCKHCHEYLDYTLRELHAQKGQLNQLQANQIQASQTGTASLAAAQVSAALVPVVQQREQMLQQWNTTTSTQAAFLSFFVPGLGQMCSGRVPAGLLWMMFTCLGYVCFIVPGIVLHILCVINASRQPQQQLT